MGADWFRPRLPYQARFPKKIPSLPLLPCLISLIYVKQVENFAFISKFPLKSFGWNLGKHYLCTRFRPSAGLEV